MQGQPGPARPGGEPPGQDPGQRPLRAEGRRPAGADHVRQQDQEAGLHGLPVQDEQTGGHCPTLAKHFTGTQRKWFTFTNGTHVDSLAPETFNRWYDFLQLYVARQAPITRSAAIQAAAPVIYQVAMGISGVTMPPDPIQQQPTYAGAKAAFEQLKPIRVLFDNGAGGSDGRRSRIPASSSLSRASPSRAPPPASGTSRPRARSAPSRPLARGPIRLTGTPTPGR